MITLNPLVFAIGFTGIVCFGLAVAVYRLNKKLKENDRQRLHDLQTLRYEAIAGVRPLEALAYQASQGTEAVVYDGRHEIKEGDFTGTGARAWDYVAHRFSDESGEGSHQIQGNVIIINRTNAAGRYELHLKHFVFNGNRYENVPASTMRRVRKLHLSLEVKKGRASHVLRFVFKGEISKEVLDEKDCVVFNPEWEKADVFFTVAANEDCLFRIDDLLVMEEQSTVEIRNLVLFEKR